MHGLNQKRARFTIPHRRLQLGVGVVRVHRPHIAAALSPPFLHPLAKDRSWQHQLGAQLGAHCRDGRQSRQARDHHLEGECVRSRDKH
jgi:hypothetical protein